MIEHECDLIDSRKEALSRYIDNCGAEIAMLDAEGIFRRAVKVLGEEIVRDMLDTWLVDRLIETEFEQLEDTAEYDRAVAAEGGAA